MCKLVTWTRNKWWNGPSRFQKANVQCPSRYSSNTNEAATALSRNGNTDVYYGISHEIGSELRSGTGAVSDGRQGHGQTIFSHCGRTCLDFRAHGQKQLRMYTNRRLPRIPYLSENFRIGKGILNKDTEKAYWYEIFGVSGVVGTIMRTNCLHTYGNMTIARPTATAVSSPNKRRKVPQR